MKTYFQHEVEVDVDSWMGAGALERGKEEALKGREEEEVRRRIGSGNVKEGGRNEEREEEGGRCSSYNSRA